MTRLRLLIIMLTTWMIILFNIERLELLNINIPSTLYIVTGIWLLPLLLLPTFGQIRKEWTIVPAVLLYISMRYFEILSSLPMTVVSLIIESLILVVTIWIGQKVSSNLENINVVVDEVVLGDIGNRILSTRDGEDAMNTELFRARKFDRPVALLFLEMPSINRLREAYTHNLRYQLSLEHRYIKSRFARITESLLYQVDVMVWHGDNLVICLPETNKEQAEKLALQIANVATLSLNVDFQLGIATFPQDGLIYEDLIKVAQANLKSYFTQDNDDGNSPSIYKNISSSTKLSQDSKFNLNNKSAITQITEKVKILTSIFLRDVSMVPENAFEHIKTDMSRPYYDPDYWVNRLPQQSASSRLIYNYMKHGFDILAILIIFPFLLPIVFVIMLLIKLEDGGAIFYSQNRTGLGGRKFKMYKFRSMIENADQRLEQLGVHVNERNETVNEKGEKLLQDPRITRIGHILRKTSLDELPQLFNVFRGDMSLVGPRPTSFGVDKYQLYHTHRLSVKPGITGLWQIHDRGDTDFDNRLVWDIKYIDKLSLMMDIQILIRTVSAVVHKKGAR
jgi:lipopolysaccharide/colanic/teichoic acid biosynthesis glycosyltransferase/GGDEF domain-containing protein